MRNHLSRTARLLLIALIMAATFIISCNSNSVREKPTEIKWPAMENLASINVTDIRAIHYTRSTEAGAESGHIEDATQIEDVYLRLKDISIKDTSDMGVDDDGLDIKLETTDKSLTFSFEGDILVLEDGSRYEVENLSSLKNYIDSLIAETADNTDTEPSGDSNSTSSAGSSQGSSNSLSAGNSTNNTTGSKDYDVSTNFSKTTNSDGSIECLYFNDFMMIMPGNEKWSFEMNGDSVSFYLFSAQQEGYGGHLVTIKAYDLDDNSYEQLPSYHVAGVGNNVNKRFVAIYPTDVQWNGADSTQDADYRELKDYLWKIGEGAVNSPLQTADSNPEN